MYRVREMSRGGWIVVGILVAVVLVPTGVATAAMLKYTGIEGTNGQTSTVNKAEVTSAGRLLTSGSPLAEDEDYEGVVGSTGGQYDCESVGSAIPTGEAFVIVQVDDEVLDADVSTTTAGVVNSNSFVGLSADGPGVTCGDGADIVNASAPDGNVGNVTIPLDPGFIVPSGYTIDAGGVGIQASIFVTGYLVPADEAPTTPQNVTNGKMPLPVHHAS
jgi:hypothetical protein